MAGLSGRARPRAAEKRGKPHGRGRRTAAVALASVLAILLVALTASFLAGRDARFAREAPSAHPGGIPGTRYLIPPEELFLPDEPDFVPGVMLGRERRAEWTAEDAEPWWQNPLVVGEERWRAEIERMVDEIMESVP